MDQLDQLRILLNRLASLFRSHHLDADLDEELRSHLDLAIDEHMQRGMSRKQARTAALRSFGGLTQTKEHYRAQRGLPFLEVLVQDTRYALRQLRKSPAFTFTVLATLALGIGATTAIFSVVDSVLLKPLPFPNAGRLIGVESMIVASGRGGAASYLDFLDFRARNHGFDEMAVVRTADYTLIGPRQPLHLVGAAVSARLFSLLGVTPSLGRGFLPEEDLPATAGGSDPVILSHGLWQREFGSDTSILGRVVQLADQRFTVVGVMPQGFQFPIQAEPVELWTTIAPDARGGANAMTAQRGVHYLDVIGLLKPVVPIQQAQAEMVAIASALNKEHPENKPRTVQLVPELQLLAGDLRTPLLVLLGAVACVLLIVCANIANLLLAQATGRRKEMAVRIALGASRGRMICQLLTQSLLLGLAGGGLGLALAFSSFRFLVRIMPAEIPRHASIGIDARLLAFAFFASLLAGILFGLAPALQASRIAPLESLKDDARGGEARSHGRLRAALAVSEMAFATVLLLGAGLLLRSFLRLTQVNPGFDPHHVLTFQLDAPAGPDSAPSPAFFREVVARMRALPGVTSASATASLPLTGDHNSSSIEIEGQPTPLGSRPQANFNVVEPQYFQTTGTSLYNGRDFTAQDNSKSTPVVIINRTLAALFFPNQNPLGRHVRPGIGNGYGPGEAPMREIVGVIEDVKQSAPGVETAPEVYMPLAQCPFDNMFIAVRTASDPVNIVHAARLQVAALDKNLPIYHVKTLDQYFADSVAQPRLVSLLLSSFAALAVLLACLGVYGVVSYTVVQRTHDIGIRMALGANSGNVVRSVLGRGMQLALAGVILGLAGSFGLARLLSSMLFGVRATDLMTFAAAALALLAVAAFASYIPARRAASIDPMQALRTE